MRKIFITLTLLTLFASTHIHAQVRSYEISTDPNNGEKVLKGLLLRSDIENDTAFKWFKDNMKFGQADAAAVAAFKQHAQDIQLVVFGGTWCEDTQFILPKFFKLQEQAGFPDAGVSFFGVDRTKKTIGGITDAFKVSNVPTIIVMKDGKEVGRVVEYGKTGQWDKELAELLK